MVDEEIVPGAAFVSIFRPEDVRVETYYPGGTGGMQVGMTTAVRATHIPTGFVSVSRSERSMHKNKMAAIKELQRIVESYFGGMW